MVFKRHIIILFWILLIAVNVFAVADDDASNLCVMSKDRSIDKLSVQKKAELLGWSRDKCSSSFCGGCYVCSDNIVNNPSPLAMREMPMDITAQETAVFNQRGTSVVRGDVHLTQPGREITADCVTFFRDSKTSKVQNGVLVGNAHLQEYDKLFVADKGNFDFVTKQYVFEDGIYRILGNTPSGITNVWGRSKHTIRDPQGVIKMRNATYSACPPDDSAWYLWSRNLTLDHNIGRGKAYNAFLFFKKIPVFYAPYFSFPINQERKSGFLYPSVSFSRDFGYEFSVPYYFNLAPNYDATVTPNYFSKRGILFDGEFRYLLPGSDGIFAVNYIPGDRGFADFRDDASSYPAGHARSALEDSSVNRAFFKMHHKAIFNDHWDGSLDINYVTDDYFLQDFALGAAMSTDQLFNQANINYADENWYFAGGLQGFQTLHPIGSSVAEQYKRLPQINFGGHFADGFGGLSYKFNSDIVNFVRRNNFETDTVSVAGGRYHIDSDVSLPFNWLGAYLTPHVQIQATAYDLHDASVGYSNNVNRVIPSFLVDSGMIFSKDTSWGKENYIQTLEPRLFYLFVPEVNQDSIPIFDTVFSGFDFNQLFRANRFSGIDRIGDANQFSAAVTSRLLDEYGQEKLLISAGQIFALSKHKVVANDDVDPLRNYVISPLAANLQYHITPKFNVQADTSWNPNNHRFNNAHVALQYQDSSKKVVNFWYNYSLQGGNIYAQPEKHEDLSSIGSSLGWCFWKHWNVFGNIDYNISNKSIPNYAYGLEYDSCCWAARVLQERIFVGRTGQTYEFRTYFQLVFKGLGSRDLLGGSFTGILPGKIRGYSDIRSIGL